MTKLDSIKKHGGRFQGRKELVNHLNGGKLTQKQAITAHCYDCMGYYSDGAESCEMSDCSLYPFMPYNPNRRMSVEKPPKS